MAIAVALVLMAIGMPNFLRAYHAYQLTNAAQKFSDILRLTRYDAIRLNKNVNCVIKPDAVDPTRTDVFADENGDTLPGPLEKIILLDNGGNLVDSGGVPGTAALLAAANVTGGNVTPAPGNATITFDSRGAVNPATAVNVFYLASPNSTEAGFRAVLLMPAGSIQMWSGDASGTWRHIR